MTTPLGADAVFFQFGYVTPDLDAAMSLWQKRHDVAGFYSFDTRDWVSKGATAPFLRVALCYQGPVMIELIEPDPEDAGIYGDALRDDSIVTLHHLGYHLDAEAYAPLADAFRAQQIDVPVVRAMLFYADTRADNGLFTEMVARVPAADSMFAQIPRADGPPRLWPS